MSSRVWVFGGVLAVGFGLATVSWLSIAKTNGDGPEFAKSDAGARRGEVTEHQKDSASDHDNDLSLVKLSNEQIAAARISVTPVNGGKILQHLLVPGTIVMDSDRISRVAANVAGTVTELRKKLGDAVQKDEVVAVLESREVADARGEYLTALVTYELQSTLFDRDRSLWLKQVMAEQQFLKARSAFTEARVRADLAKQKLLALNLNNQEIDTLARQASATVEAKETTIPSAESTKTLRRYELRSPIAGRVVDRKVDLGAPVGKEGQEAEIYVIADLSKVWIELSIPTADLEKVKEGQTVTIKGNISSKQASGKIVFISPRLNKETRTACVIAAIENRDLIWHAGSFVTAEVGIDEKTVDRRIPISAIQKANGQNAVFVRTAEGFEKRDIVLGQHDGDGAEVLSGVSEGELIAVSNTFTLKAELGKAMAEDSD